MLGNAFAKFTPKSQSFRKKLNLAEEKKKVRALCTLDMFYENLRA